MIRYEAMYKEKCKTPAELAAYVKSNDICACPSALGEPVTIVDAVADRIAEDGLTGVTHHMNMTVRNMKYLRPEWKGKYHAVCWFIGGAARKPISQGLADYFPSHFHEDPRSWRNDVHANVFYAMVSPMDDHGYFSFSACAGEAQALIRTADIILLEVNDQAPRTLGDNFIHISQVTAFCESSTPLPILPTPERGEKDEKIASYIVDMIPDGATVQFGVGRIPDAVGSLLKSKKHLGIHSELFCTSMYELVQCGAVDNSRKNINRGRSVFTFLFGTKDVYDFANNNPGVEGHPVDYVNDPRIVCQNDNVMAVNGCVEADLLGQVCSESIGSVSISGSGGQCDFIRGANWSKGGKSFLTMYSTAKDDEVSTIQFALSRGAHVTILKNDADYIVTEYGAAKMRGKTASQRAKAMISIAHPKFREELTAEAKKIGLMI